MRDIVNPVIKELRRVVLGGLNTLNFSNVLSKIDFYTFYVIDLLYLNFFYTKHFFYTEFWFRNFF